MNEKLVFFKQSPWPKQTELHGIFGGSLSHDVKSGHFKKYLIQSLCIYYGSSFGFVRDSCVLEHVCLYVSICIPCDFTLALFLVCLCSPILICLFFIYHVALPFIIVPQMLVCFLRRYRKDVAPKGDGYEQGGVEGGETIIRIYCIKKSIFNKKEISYLFTLNSHIFISSNLRVNMVITM